MADANLAITHVTTAGVVVFIINWLKKSPYFPWITAQNTRILRALAVVGAGAAGLGIHYVWNPSDHSLVITGLSLAGILTAAGIWLKSFVTQEIIYQSTSKTALGDTLQQILKLLQPPAQQNPSVTVSQNPVAPASKQP